MVTLRIQAGLPAFVFAHLGLARSNAVWVDGSEAARCLARPRHRTTGNNKCNKCNVALYSHGKFAWRQLDSRTCEAMASKGFVVFAVDHAPDAALSRPVGLPDHARSADFTAESGASTQREQAYARDPSPPLVVQWGDTSTLCARGRGPLRPGGVRG